MGTTLKIPTPDDRGHLIFDATQIANIEVLADPLTLSLRLRGEETRHVYLGDLASSVHLVILKAKTAEDNAPLLELDRCHYRSTWKIFPRGSSAYIGTGKDDDPVEALQEG